MCKRKSRFDRIWKIPTDGSFIEIGRQKNNWNMKSTYVKFYWSFGKKKNVLGLSLQMLQILKDFWWLGKNNKNNRTNKLSTFFLDSFYLREKKMRKILRHFGKSEKKFWRENKFYELFQSKKNIWSKILFPKERLLALGYNFYKLLKLLVVVPIWLTGLWKWSIATKNWTWIFGIEQRENKISVFYSKIFYKKIKQENVSKKASKY